ncbi:hypothetical protein ZEAMMB73_Zm00001d028001 [Zea mays]|uniref:Uncharacterized protein n=1 Tax=Zea mays TaxID=4577 RepID=A0A1D6JR73_MAIZE|nr:hypothetical protein ZEAMMB73_Zm00001d028001 [Zea mays]
MASLQDFSAGPVPDAIKRKLAVETSVPPQQSSFSYVTGQKQPQNWYPTKKKVKVPHLPSQILQCPRPNVVPSFWCKICKVDCVTEFNFSAHVGGKKHKAKKLEILGTLGAASRCAGNRSENGWFWQLPKYHEDPTTEELAKTLDCWPSMNYYITGCRYVLMPWKFNKCYALFVIDHGKKHVSFIDFTPTQDWCKHIPYKRVNTSYLVLQAMVMWGNGRRMEFVRDARILRRNFVIDLLSYEDNSCRYAIPANIQHRLINISTKE